MKSGQLNSKFSFPSLNAYVNVNVPFYVFSENGSEVIFCPSLDLYGYGKTIEDAQKSINYSMEQFFRYTTQRKTIFKILENKGWKMKKKRSIKMIPPSIEKLLVDNEDFNDILTNKNPRVHTETISIPHLELA